MKTIKLLFTVAALLAVCSLSAQTDCVGDKYVNPAYFTNVKSTKNIVYGSNKPGGSSTSQTLRLDVYEPTADTLTGRANRPLIILAHGGSFIGGSRSECAPLCTSFAKMGYVAATIDYRLGMTGFPPNDVITTQAVVRAMQDMKAAVRYFRKDVAENGNTFGIDTNRIIVGGISAGAITAIQTAYLDQDSEIPGYLLNDTAGLGGIEGASGNAGYSSKSHGVINYAGAIGDTSWIDAGDVPIISFHYIGDVTVPYDTREVKVSGLPTGLIASGSGSMKTRLDNIGVINELYSYPGVGHVDFLDDPEYDSVMNKTMVFLYNNVTCKTTTGIFASDDNNRSRFEIYPNPSNGKFVVRLKDPAASPVKISVYNSVGRLVFQKENMTENQLSFEQDYWSRGLYVVAIQSENSGTSIKKLMIE